MRIREITEKPADMMIQNFGRVKDKNLKSYDRLRPGRIKTKKIGLKERDGLCSSLSLGLIHNKVSTG